MRIRRANIAAIPLILADGVPAQLGTITRLPQSAELEVCGDGFNERTVLVRWRDSFYYVFRADVEIPPAV